MRRIVSDTGPLLHLQEAASLDLLDKAGSVSIPPAVYSEILHLSPTWRDETPDWLNLQELNPASSENARRWLQAGLLHAGEAQAVALALQLQADWLLTDDSAARLIAEQQGLEVHGSIGVILWGAASGQLLEAEARNSLDALSRSSLWVSSRVLEEAKVALGQIFS